MKDINSPATLILCMLKRNCILLTELFYASVLQELICSLLLLMNSAILWDLLIQMSVKLWCTLSTHMWTQQPSGFQRMIGEEFRSYTVNSLWDLIFKIKFTGLQVSLLSLIARALSYYQKERRGTDLGKTHSCILHPLCSFCSMSTTKRWWSSSAAAWHTVFLHTYILPNKSVHRALQTSCFSEWDYWQGNVRYCVTYQVNGAVQWRQKLLSSRSGA